VTFTGFAAGAAAAFFGAFFAAFFFTTLRAMFAFPSQRLSCVKFNEPPVSVGISAFSHRRRIRECQSFLERALTAFLPNLSKTVI
jgi:hypothetical protein